MMRRLPTALLLAALLLAALPTSGLASPPLARPTSIGETPELEETLDEAGEFESGEACFEEGGEAFCEEEDEEEEAEAEACPLRSVSVHAVEHDERLRVTVGYTNERPTSAKVEVGHGSTHVGAFERHLGRSGVLRFSGKLPKHHGHRLRVVVRAPFEGRYCAEEAAVLFR